VATHSTTAPSDEPALRAPSTRFSQRAAASASGQKNGFRPISAASNRAGSIASPPISLTQPVIATPSSTLRATAPAATRAAVSRAEDRPPPR
jgi:hypothetical protein